MPTPALSLIEESLNSLQSCALDSYDVHTHLSVHLLILLTLTSAVWLELSIWKYENCPPFPFCLLPIVPLSITPSTPLSEVLLNFIHGR